MADKQEQQGKGGKFSINFGNIPDNNIPKGEYEMVINKVELKEGNAAPYLNWEFEITEGEYAGRKVWAITSLADAALFRLKQFAEGLGFEGNFEFEIDEDTNMVISPDFSGCLVTASTGINEYQGQKRAQVVSIDDYHTTDHLPDDDDEDEFEDDEDGEEYGDDDDDDEFEALEEEEAEPEAVAPALPTPAKKKTRK